eukprot:scaffold29086_cov101-Isochrysis_galbana.AAC.3
MTTHLSRPLYRTSSRRLSTPLRRKMRDLPMQYSLGFAPTHSRSNSSCALSTGCRRTPPVVLSHGGPKRAAKSWRDMWVEKPAREMPMAGTRPELVTCLATHAESTKWGCFASFGLMQRIKCTLAVPIVVSRALSDARKRSTTPWNLLLVVPLRTLKVLTQRVPVFLQEALDAVPHPASKVAHDKRLGVERNHRLAPACRGQLGRALLRAAASGGLVRRRVKQRVGLVHLQQLGQQLRVGPAREHALLRQRSEDGVEQRHAAPIVLGHRGCVEAHPLRRVELLRPLDHQRDEHSLEAEDIEQAHEAAGRLGDGGLAGGGARSECGPELARRDCAAPSRRAAQVAEARCGGQAAAMRAAAIGQEVGRERGVGLLHHPAEDPRIDGLGKAVAHAARLRGRVLRLDPVAARLDAPDAQAVEEVGRVAAQEHGRHAHRFVVGDGCVRLARSVGAGADADLAQPQDACQGPEHLLRKVGLVRGDGAVGRVREVGPPTLGGLRQLQVVAHPWVRSVCVEVRRAHAARCIVPDRDELAVPTRIVVAERASAAERFEHRVGLRSRRPAGRSARGTRRARQAPTGSEGRVRDNNISGCRISPVHPAPWGAGGLHLDDTGMHVPADGRATCARSAQILQKPLAGLSLAGAALATDNHSLRLVAHAERLHHHRAHAVNMGR